MPNRNINLIESIYNAISSMHHDMKVVVNSVALSLGITSFADLVNIWAVVASILWISLQVYGYFKYELPMKKYRLEAEKLKRQARKENKEEGPFEDRYFGSKVSDLDELEEIQTIREKFRKEEE